MRKLLYGCLPQRYRKSLPAPDVVSVTLENRLAFKYLYRGDPVGHYLFWAGVKDHHEAASARLFVRLAKRAKTVFDIGANTGIYSIIAAIANPRAAVFSFEPVPRIYARLRENVDLNQLETVHAVHAAVGEVDGSLILHVPKAPFPTDASCRKGFRPDTEQVRVDSMRLDTFVARQGVDTTDMVMMIDTETTEHLVLEGCGDMLTRDRPVIVCEVLKGFVEEELQMILAANDYRAYWISPNGLEKQEVIRPDPTYHNKNYLFVHQDQEEQVLRDLAE
jgi:FkbM family methyltransferase